MKTDFAHGLKPPYLWRTLIDGGAWRGTPDQRQFGGSLAKDYSRRKRPAPKSRRRAEGYRDRSARKPRPLSFAFRSPGKLPAADDSEALG